jgi:hypothetical protein
MACEEQWYAVMNLIRRNRVASDEFTNYFEGKIAFDWAKHYGEEDRAKELHFYVRIRAIICCPITS